MIAGLPLFLKRIPLFVHLNSAELSFLSRNSEIVEMEKGQSFIPYDDSISIVYSGVLDLQVSGGTSGSMFISEGAFLGDIPFAENTPKGKLVALSQVRIICIKSNSIYRLFFESYKALRGYLKSVNRLGISLSSYGKRYLENRTKVVAVTGSSDSGKSLISSILASSLAKEGRVVIVDASLSGRTVFDNFNEMVTPPISERGEIDESDFNFESRIKYVSSDLALFNLSFASRTQLNSEILSPVLFKLSQYFRYVVLDISFDNLSESLLGYSDYISFVAKSEKDIVSAREFVDSSVSDAQKVVYLLNGYYAKNARKIEGALYVEDLKIESPVTVGKIENLVDSEISLQLKSFVNSKRSGIVLPSSGLRSLAYSGLFSALSDSKKSYDYIYSSYLTTLITGIFLVSESTDDYYRKLNYFFAEERLAHMFDIKFPDKNMIRSGKVSSYCNKMFKDIRLEHLNVHFLAKAADISGNERIFSTGEIKDIAAASFLIHPLFESLKIGNRSYHSGYPYTSANPLDIYRYDIDEITTYLVKSNEKPKAFFRVLPMCSEYLAYLEKHIDSNVYGPVSDSVCEIEIDVKDKNFDEILKTSHQLWCEKIGADNEK